MEIKTNQWYRFKSNKDKKNWLETLNKLVLPKGKSINPDGWMSYELLRYNGTAVNVRTKDNPRYDGANAITWIPDETIHADVTYRGIQSSSGYDPQDYEYIKINVKENKTMKLIENAEREAINKLNDEHTKEVEKFVKTTVAYVSLTAALKAINKDRDKSKEIDIESLLTPHMLTDKENDELLQSQKSHNDRVKETEKKFLELKELYNITETYEQKVALLKEYNIVR